MLYHRVLRAVVLGVDARVGADGREDFLVEAELVRLLDHLLVAEVVAHLPEDGVARPAQGLPQRGVLAGDVALVAERRGGLRQRPGERGFRLGVDVVVEPVLQGGGGGDDLEGGARRVGLAQRPVEHRLVLVLQELLPGLGVLVGVAREDGGVVRGSARQRQHGAGLRVEGDDGPLLLAEPLEGGLLGVAVQGGDDVAALLLVPGEHREGAVEEQLVVVAGQDAVLQVLQLRGVERLRGVAGDGGPRAGRSSRRACT